MSLIIDFTIRDFLEQLAAKQATPGGGSASALGGAIGTALASMAANFTLGNEKYKEFEAEAGSANANLERIRESLTHLADSDIAAYKAYRTAVALPKNTPEEKAVRSQLIFVANKNATSVPLSILSAALAALVNVEILSRASNPNLAGDVASAAYFLEACARGAAIQIFSNCAANDEKGENAALRKKAAEDVAQCEVIRKKIDAAVLTMLKIEA